MNNFPATLSFLLGGLLLSIWIFDGFFIHIVFAIVAGIVGFIIDANRNQ